jgi:hypothetical protein
MICRLDELSEGSRVWIYQSDKDLTPFQNMEIRTLLRDFMENWTAHNQSLKAFGDTYHDRFIVIFADETYAGASGCSIDKATHFIENLGAHYGIDFFDRRTVSYFNDNKQIEQVSLDVLPELLSAGNIRMDTLFFDNLVKTKREWEEKWIVPLSQSWINKFI